MNRRGIWYFSRGAAITGTVITLLFFVAGMQTTIIGVWTLINLFALGYIARTGGF